MSLLTLLTKIIIRIKYAYVNRKIHIFYTHILKGVFKFILFTAPGLKRKVDGNIKKEPLQREAHKNDFLFGRLATLSS